MCHASYVTQLKIRHDSDVLLMFKVLLSSVFRRCFRVIGR